MLMSTETSCPFGHLLQVLKISSKSDFIHIFSWFYTCIYPRGRGWQSLETKFWCQQEHLFTSVICCKFQKISLKSDFIQFFHDFIHVYSPGARADSPQGTKFGCQQKRLVTSFICCKFKKKSLQSLILQEKKKKKKKKKDLRYRIESENHQGTKFWCQQKRLVTPFICYKFQKISLKSDFIHFFPWFDTCI